MKKINKFIFKVHHDIKTNKIFLYNKILYSPLKIKTKIKHLYFKIKEYPMNKMPHSKLNNNTLQKMIKIFKLFIMIKKLKTR